MTTFIMNDQKMKMQLTATNTNLSFAMTKLYGSVLKYLELDERKAEKAYYASMISAYSQTDEKSEEMSESFMSLSEEADNLIASKRDEFYD